MAYRIEQTGAELQGILDDAVLTKQGFEDEVARAQAAEGVLQENIDSEAGERQGADALLAGNIGTEVARAQQAEGDLGVRIDANTAGVAAEVARAQEAEGQVWDTLNDEILTRQSQDAALQGNIEREAGLREAGDGQLQGEIDTISGKIPAEASEMNQLADKQYVQEAMSDVPTREEVEEMVDTLSRNEVVVGALPQAGEEGVIYRVPGNGYYTDYMYYDGEFVELSQYNMEFDQTQVGYFTCDTAAGTAAKTVSAAGYTLAVGGNMRIKMTNANTADNVTLNINGAGAKALYYNGEQASATNSWEAGEVLTIYYDGTQYQTDVAPDDVEVDTSLSISGMAADAKTVGDNLFEYHDVTYDKTSGVVWTQGAIDDSGNDVASYSKVRNTGYLPLKNKHVFTYGSVALYTIYLYDFDYRYLGKVTELTDDTEIDARAAWIRIVAGQGSPYVYPSTMANDGWSWDTQESSPVIPALQELVEPVNELVNDRMELRKIDVAEVLRADNKKIFDFNLDVNATTEYVAQALIHLDGGDYIVRKNGAPNQATIFAKSSSDSEIVSGTVAYLKTANPDGDYEMTLDDGYYLITIDMVTNTSYVTFWQQGEISVKGITSNASAIDAIHGFVEPIGIATFGNCVQTSEAFAPSDGFRFVTIKGGACDKPSLLDSITVGVTGDGVMRFFVGKIDQRSAAMDIKDRYFDVSVEDGIHAYDVTDKEVILESGEYLFCYVSYYGNAVLNVRSHANFNTPVSLRPMLSQAVDETSVVVEQQNSDVTLLWTVSAVQSVFAYKSQIRELEGKVESQGAELNKAGIVYDDNGTPYSLRVVNGAVVPKTMRFTKVLAIGNSLTDHPYNIGINWLTHGYSMAATSLETSWTYQFQRVLRRYNPNAEVKGFSLYNWEANPLINPADIRSSDTRQEDIRYLRDELTTDLDCVIFRAGENGNPSMSDFETGLCNLVEYIQEKSPNATILMCNMFWHVASKEEVISKVASKYGLKFVDCGNVGYRREITGGFCWNEDKSEMFMIANTSVGIHTSDEGFYLFANRLASACGLEELPNEIHNVNITSSVNYFVKSKFGVKGGLISIITSYRQTVVVTDSQGNNIPVTIKDITDQPVIAPDFVAVFTMPDDDVDVVIS